MERCNSSTSRRESLESGTECKTVAHSIEISFFLTQGSRPHVYRHLYLYLFQCPSVSCNSVISITVLNDGSIEANLGLWNQMLQENSWHIIQRAYNKRICVAIGRYMLAWRQQLLLSTVKHRKLSWFGYVCRHALPKIILQGTVDGRRGRPRKSRKVNIKVLTGQSMSPLLRIADDRGRWAIIAADASVGVPPTMPGLFVIIGY